jgi:outer membrane lipoprotein-sorting protein
MFKLKITVISALAFGTLAIAPAALAAPPSSFTSKGIATSTQSGKTTQVPNTLYYQQGKIRLEMAKSISPDGAAAFSVVLAHEGGKTITMLNTDQHQAMKLEASSLEDVTQNQAMQRISNFKLTEFGSTFRANSKKVGNEVVAGQACTILDHKGKDGQFRLWLSDKYDLPMKFTYFESGKPAFSYTVTQFTPSSSLPAASFVVPAGYQLTDVSEMLKGLEQQHK